MSENNLSQFLFPFLLSLQTHIKKKKSAFGPLFERAAQITKSRITNHGFDSAVVEIQRDDLVKFIDSLHAELLE